MGRGNLRDLNARNGPRDTMRRSGALISITPAEPSSKRRHDTTESLETTSPFFSQPQQVHDLTNGHKDDPVEIKSSTSTGDQGSKAVTTVEEYRNTQRQNAGYKRPRPRYHKGNKTPQKGQSPFAEVEPLMRPKNPDLRSIDSPDCLATDPLPANVVSDMKPRTGRPKRILETDSSEPPFKRNRRQQAETIESSEDELQGGAQSRRINPRGAIRPTVFKSQTLSKVASQNSADYIHLRKALGARCILESQPGAHVHLKPINNETSFIGVVPRFDGAETEYDWLRIDKRSIEKIECAENGSRFVHIRRSATESQPAKLHLEFASTHESGRFLHKFKEKLVHKDPEILEKIFKTSVQEIQDYNAKQSAPKPDHGSLSTASRLRHTSPEVKEQPNHNTANSNQPQEKIKDRLLRAAHQDDKSSDSIQQKHEQATISPLAPPRRSTRYSEATFLLGFNASNMKWSSNNPDWHEKWQPPDKGLGFPLTGRSTVTIAKDDIPKLDDGEFLNDNLIEFYLTYLQLEKESENVSKKVYIFSSFFFNKLSPRGGRIDYDGVRKWTNKVDLFSYDYIVVPVNENLHWYLAIICNPSKTLSQRSAGVPVESTSVVDKLQSQQSLFLGGSRKADPSEPKIMTLDSLGTAHSLTCKALKSYLAEEAKDKKNLELAILPAGMTAKGLPEQQNYCDCGIFVLAYMEEFLRNPDEIAGKLLRRESHEWDIRPSELRAKIRDLIFRLKGEQHLQRIREKRAKHEEKKNKAKQPLSSQEVTTSPPKSPPKQTPVADVHPLSSLASKFTNIFTKKTTAATSELSPSPQKPEAPVTPTICTRASPKLTSRLNSSSDDGPQEEAFFSPQSPQCERIAPHFKEDVAVSSHTGGVVPGSEPDYVKKLSSSESGDGTVNASPAKALKRRRVLKPPGHPHDPFHPKQVDQVEAESIMESVEAEEPSESKTGATYDGID